MSGLYTYLLHFRKLRDNTSAVALSLREISSVKFEAISSVKFEAI